LSRNQITNKLVTTRYRKAVSPNMQQMRHQEISPQIDLLIKAGEVEALGRAENLPEMRHK